MTGCGVVGASVIASVMACTIACGKQSDQRSSPIAPTPPAPATEPDDAGPICAATAAKYYAPALARVRGTTERESPRLR